MAEPQVAGAWTAQIVTLFPEAFPGTLGLSLTGRALAEGTVRGLGLTKQLAAVRHCRGIGKRDMKLNDALPRITVDSETYEVRADGELLVCEPAVRLPLAQRFSLF